MRINRYEYVAVVSNSYQNYLSIKIREDKIKVCDQSYITLTPDSFPNYLKTPNIQSNQSYSDSSSSSSSSSDLDINPLYIDIESLESIGGS